MTRDIISISDAWLTLDMINELHNNITILYDSDQLEWLSYDHEKEWEALVDSWHLNTTFIEMFIEAYTKVDLDDETDDIDIEDNHKCNKPSCPYCNNVDWDDNLFE